MSMKERLDPISLARFVDVNIRNLAGVPSVVYGILGLTVFVRMFGLFASGSYNMELALGVATLRVPLPLGRSLLRRPHVLPARQ